MVNTFFTSASEESRNDCTAEAWLGSPEELASISDIWKTLDAREELIAREVDSNVFDMLGDTVDWSHYAGPNTQLYLI